jgi:glycosyltransferase involved in cell wall biosynthesis
MSALKRVVMLCSVPPPHHGVTIFNQNLLRSEVGQGFEVMHIDTSDHRNLDNIGRFDFRNSWFAIKNIVQLATACLTHRPELVYVPISQNNLGFLRDGLFVLTAKVFSKARIVVHYHGGDTFNTFRLNTNIFMRWFIRLVLGQVNVGIVVGEKLRGVLEGLVKRVEVVANGSTFNPSISVERNGSSAMVKVSYLGTLAREKGVIDLLKAALFVLSTHTNVQFRFAGKWWGQEQDTRREAMELVRQSGLDHHFDFVGEVLDAAKERFLFESDIVVFPSWIDSFGLVNLEAMAAGCPVVSSRGVGAIDEVVLDGVTGILVEKQNVRQLADAIICLIDNPKLRATMGMAGRNRFLNQYTFDKTATKLAEVFAGALS